MLARNALTDLFPYAVMHVEQRLQAQDTDSAARVLALMQRADPAAPVWFLAQNPRIPLRCIQATY